MTVVLCHKLTDVNWLLVTVSCFETKCILKVTESFCNGGFFTESFCNGGFFTESFCNGGFLSVVSEGQKPKEVEVEDVSYYEAGWPL